MTDVRPFSIYIDVYHKPPEGGDLWMKVRKIIHVYVVF